MSFRRHTGYLDDMYQMIQSPRPLRPNDLGLILSYSCQSACAHCVYACGGVAETWMTPGEVDCALDALQHWEHPFQLHLSGGEPFLNFPLLLHAVEAAAERRIPVYSETNAGWCVRPDLVRERFRALRQAGMGMILISCSPFHAETIPPARTALAASIAAEIFGEQQVVIFQGQWFPYLRQFGLDCSTALEDYIEAYGERQTGELFWNGYGLLGGGRAGITLGHLTARLPAGAFAGLNCRQELLFASHSHFDSYGNLVPGFCGGLRLGSWRQLEKLEARCAAGDLDPLIRLLHDGGPYALQQHPLATDLRLAEEGYVDKCHLCVDLRRQLFNRASLAELSPAGFYQRIMDRT